VDSRLSFLGMVVVFLSQLELSIARIIRHGHPYGYPYGYPYVRSEGADICALFHLLEYP